MEKGPPHGRHDEASVEVHIDDVPSGDDQTQVHFVQIKASNTTLVEVGIYFTGIAGMS